MEITPWTWFFFFLFWKERNLYWLRTQLLLTVAKESTSIVCFRFNSLGQDFWWVPSSRVSKECNRMLGEYTRFFRYPSKYIFEGYYSSFILLSKFWKKFGMENHISMLCFFVLVIAIISSMAPLSPRIWMIGNFQIPFSFRCL